MGSVAAHPQDLLRPTGVTFDIDGLRNPRGPVDARDHGPVEAETACLFRNSIDQLRDRGDPMQPPERIVHAREGRNALGEPDLTKPALGLLELEEKVDRAGAVPREGCVLPILPDSLGDALRRGCQGSLRGWKVDDRQGPRIALRSTQVAHAVNQRQDVTHIGAGNPRTVTEPRPLAIPCACGQGPRRSGLSDHVSVFRLRDTRRRGVARRPGTTRPGHQPTGAAGAGRVAVRRAGIGCYKGIRDHHGQPAAVYVTPSLFLMSARRMCFWTFQVAVMGRADTISRRSGSFCVASFCARR